MQDSINSKNKVLYYTRSARGCYRLAKEFGERAAFLISDYNAETDKITKEKLIDIMARQGVKNYVIEHERLPDDIDILFINSACREGMNLKDENVKTVICEAPDMMTIWQVFGRIRHNVERFIVVLNRTYEKFTQRDCEEYYEFMRKYDAAAAEEKELVLAEQYGRQQGMTTMTVMVYKYHGDYYLNEYLRGFLAYMEDCYISLRNWQEQTKFIRTLDENTYDIPSQRQYIQQLSRFTHNRIKINIVKTEKVEKANEAAISKLLASEDKWLSRELSTQDCKAFCTKMGFKRSNTQAAGWKTVMKILRQHGYIVTQVNKGHTKALYMIER